MFTLENQIPIIDDSPMTKEKLSEMRRRLEEQVSDMPRENSDIS